MCALQDLDLHHDFSQNLILILFETVELGILFLEKVADVRQQYTLVQMLEIYMRMLKKYVVMFSCANGGGTID